MHTNNKLREALEETNKFLEVAIVNGKVTSQDISRLRNIVSAALSSPMRNFERFADFETAQKAYLRETKTLVVGDEMFDWLFAPTRHARIAISTK